MGLARKAGRGREGEREREAGRRVGREAGRQAGREGGRERDLGLVEGTWRPSEVESAGPRYWPGPGRSKSASDSEAKLCLGAWRIVALREVSRKPAVVKSVVKRLCLLVLGNDRPASRAKAACDHVPRQPEVVGCEHTHGRTGWSKMWSDRSSCVV